jgi:hypothetical protein
MYCRGLSYHYNFDGFLTFCYSKEESNSYIQLFRNGIIEASIGRHQNDRKNIRSIYKEENVVECISQYLKILKNLGVDTPILIFLTLIGVKGYKMPRGFPGSSIPDIKIDKDVLLLPNVILDNYEDNITYIYIVRQLSCVVICLPFDYSIPHFQILT